MSRGSPTSSPIILDTVPPVFLGTKLVLWLDQRWGTSVIQRGNSWKADLAGGGCHQAEAYQQLKLTLEQASSRDPMHSICWNPTKNNPKSLITVRFMRAYVHFAKSLFNKSLVNQSRSRSTENRGPHGRICDNIHIKQIFLV